MATTRSLNSDNSVWVTTFFAGPLGRSYTFTACHEGIKASRTVTEEELFILLANPENGIIQDDGIRPAFDMV